MPTALEKRLTEIARKKGFGKKRAGNFVYGTMTNMQKRGSIEPWRKLKRRGRAKHGSGPSSGNSTLDAITE